MNFFENYIKTGQRIKKDAARYEFWGAIIEFVHDGLEHEFKHEEADIAFHGVMPSLVKSRNGRLGGQVTQEKLASAFATPSKTPSKPVSKRQANTQATDQAKCEQVEEVKEVEEVKKSRKEKPEQSRPSVKAVDSYARAYAAAIGAFPIDAQRFVDYYAAQGWRIKNGRPLVDWQAAVRNWTRRNKQGAPGTMKGGSDGVDTSIYD